MIQEAKISRILAIFLTLALSQCYKIDPDTVPITLVRKRDQKVLDLVMSDEFTQDGRSFDKGDDDIFEAQQRPDDINQGIAFYNATTEYVTTAEGSLTINTKAAKTSWIEWDYDHEHHQDAVIEWDYDHLRPVKMTKNYTSGMVQSWNKFCFTGGILELSIKLPGHAFSGGLWPAAWLMGNLARTGYQKSTVKVWPWSYSKCGLIDHLDSKQEVNACNPYPGYGMHPYMGRGAPEIDLLEVMPGHNMPGSSNMIRPFVSSSLQVSPGVTKDMHRPINGEKLNDSRTWYDGVEIGPGGEYNYGFWGAPVGPDKDHTKGQIYKYQEDAISVNTFLEETHFDRHHIYRLEWQPGPEGYLDWYIDDDFLLGINGQSLQDLTGSFIPEEPMYLIMNTAISHQWGMPEPCDIAHCATCWHCYDCTNPECQCTLPDGMKNCKNLPAKMEIDFIRLYQDKADVTHSVGCSTALHPTKEFIIGHADRYKDWSPYEGFIPVNSDIVVITICLVIVGFLVAYLASVKKHFLTKCFHKSSDMYNYVFNRRGGYTGIQDENRNDQDVQMT